MDEIETLASLPDLMDGDRMEVFRDGVTRQAHLRMLANYVNNSSIEGYRKIRNAEDFPAPVDGVITLEDNVEYLITGVVDIANNRIVMGQNTTLAGNGSELSYLKSSVTGHPMIYTQYTMPMRFVSLWSPNATALEVDTDGTQSFDWLGVNFYQCQKIATVNDFRNLVWNFGASIQCEDGFTFDGAGNAAVFQTCANVLPVSGHTFVEVTANASFASRGRASFCNFSTPSGVTTFDFTATTPSAFPNDSIYIQDCAFSGSGTYITGITAANNASVFRDNQGIQNSQVNAFMYMSGNATATTFGAMNTYTKVLGTTTLDSSTQRFTHSNNRLTYTGGKPVVVKVDIDFYFTTGNNNVAAVLIAKNGTALTTYPATTATSTGTGDYNNGNYHLIVTLNPNDYIEVFVKKLADTTSLTMTNLKVIMVEA